MDEPLEVLIGKLLVQHGLTLAIAESCTGGLVSHRITNVSGSSTYFLGGVISYANEAKVRLLGVSPETLDKFGAVCFETVLEMSRGVRDALSADIGIATSGIAGPTGGTPDKPVGTVWIGFSSAAGEEARHFLFEGNRLSIKEQAAQAALQVLLGHLQKAYN